MRAYVRAHNGKLSRLYDIYANLMPHLAGGLLCPERSTGLPS